MGNAQIISILPLGNSITQSNSDNLSYRYPLWIKLIDDNYNFDLVGNMTSNYNGSPVWPDYNGFTFDQDHEGHWGWRCDQILAQLPGWLNSYTPDIVLIHLGTNDLYQGDGSPLNISTTINELKDIITALRTDNPNVIILLAKLLPSTNTQLINKIPLFNLEIPQIAIDMDDPNSPIFIVDQFAGFDALSDTFDGVHPNVIGEEKMAEKWFIAIENATNQTAAIIPPTTTILTCTTPSISITATGGGTYSWSDGTSIVGTTATISVSNPATYTVTVTAANSSTSDAFIQIDEDATPPTVSITGSSSICIDGFTQLSPTNGGTWLSNSPSAASVDNTGLVTGLAEGNATFSFTQSSNGCSSITLEVTINDLPNNTSNIGFTGNAICNGETGMLTFDALNTSFVDTYSIEYTDGILSWNQVITDSSAFSFNVAVDPIVTTDYTLVSISNGNGCAIFTDDIQDSTAQIIVHQLPAAPTAENVTVNYNGSLHSASAFVDVGEIVDWYTDATGMVSSSAPAETHAGIYTAWAEARNITTGCKSTSRTEVTLTISQVSLNLTVMLQGPYNSGTGLMNTNLNANAELPVNQPFNVAPWGYLGNEILPTLTGSEVDWVLVELRSDINTMVARSAGLLNNNGTINVRIDDNIYPDVHSGLDYYIVIWHRNHMPVMSVGQEIVPVSSYNFTNLTNCYNNGAIELLDGEIHLGIYAMIAGDVTANGILQYSGPGNDRGLITAKIIEGNGSAGINASITGGYWYEDVNLNNTVLYTGTTNDRAPITSNITSLVGAALNNIYTSVVPGAVTPTKNAVSNNGFFDLSISQFYETVNVEITNNELLLDGLVDNIQFTLAWNTGDSEIADLLNTFESNFFLGPQGEPKEVDGVMYQVYASITPLKLHPTLVKGDKVTVLSLENFLGINISDRLWIADDEYTAASNGMYYVSVWGSDNTGTILTKPLGPGDQSSKGGVHIYPNPVYTGNLNIKIGTEQDEMLDVFIYNLHGKLVKQLKILIYGNNLNRTSVDVSTLNSGAYLLTIEGETITFNDMFIIR